MSWDCQRCDIGVDPGKNYCDDCWAEIETEQTLRPIVREAISRFAARLAEELRKEVAATCENDWGLLPVLATLGKVAAAAERAAREGDPE